MRYECSVIENAERIFPFIIGSSYFFFFSWGPYFSRTSVFSISDAARRRVCHLHHYHLEPESSPPERGISPLIFGHNCISESGQPGLLMILPITNIGICISRILINEYTLISHYSSYWLYPYDIATLHSSSELYFGTIEAIHTPLYCMQRAFSGISVENLA